MTVAEYLEAIKERLITEPVVVSFEIIRERRTLMDGHFGRVYNSLTEVSLNSRNMYSTHLRSKLK